MNSYIVLLRAGLTCTIKSSPIGRLAGAVWLSAQKDSVGSLSLLSPMKVGQYVFFPETCFASTISEPEFTV